jgi:hypothetical protein
MPGKGPNQKLETRVHIISRNPLDIEEKLKKAKIVFFKKHFSNMQNTLDYKTTEMHLLSNQF